MALFSSYDMINLLTLNAVVVLVTFSKRQICLQWISSHLETWIYTTATCTLIGKLTRYPSEVNLANAESF